MSHAITPRLYAISFALSWIFCITSNILLIVVFVSSALESDSLIFAVHSAFTGAHVVVSSTLISGVEIHSACIVVVSAVCAVGCVSETVVVCSICAGCSLIVSVVISGAFSSERTCVFSADFTDSFISSPLCLVNSWNSVLAHWNRLSIIVFHHSVSPAFLYSSSNA